MGQRFFPRNHAIAFMVVVCFASAECAGSPQTEAVVTSEFSACATSTQTLAHMRLTKDADLGQISQLVSPESWGTDAAKVTSVHSLSGACVSTVDGYDGSNLAFSGAVVIRTINEQLQDVPQDEQKGIYQRLQQRTHNSPGAPSSWSGGRLLAGVQVGSAKCPSPTGVYVAAWGNGTSGVLGLYSRSSNGARSEVRKLATVSGPVRALGFLPSADTDNGQLFLTVGHGNQVVLITVELAGAENLTPCPQP